nr:CAP domain-containing protein [Ammoniphilus oxalaticus]
MSAPNLYGISIGQSSSEILSILGEPQRKDRSSFGYDWWIYNGDLNKYIQIGIQNGKVVDVYANGKGLIFDGIKIGGQQSELERKYKLTPKVKFEFDQVHFTVDNTKAEKKLSLVDGVPILFYMDLHQSSAPTLSSIRMISIDTLIKSKMIGYGYQYSGGHLNLDSPTTITAQEKERIEASFERQLLDLTNTARIRRGASLLTWNQAASQVAKGHSLDMAINDFFSHDSSSGIEYGERLRKSGIQYRTAGENIAWGQIDAIEAHESLMNSLGHRKNILNNDFATLGVGVKGNYYTENFVTP